MEVFTAADAEAAAASAAGYIGIVLRDAVSRRGRALLAMSGGSSPVPLLDALAQLDISWEQVTVLQVDERWVGETGPDRNLTALRERLVTPTGTAVLPFTVTAGPVTAAARGGAAAADSASLRELLGPDGRIDVVHLGLGTDGHTASWPPGAVTEALMTETALVATVDDFNGFDRTTLTPVAVSAARHVVWFVPGEAKRAMLGRLCAGDGTIPAGRVDQRRAVVFTDVV